MTEIVEECTVLHDSEAEVVVQKEEVTKTCLKSSGSFNTKISESTRPILPQILVVSGSYLISLSCGISQGHSAVLLPQLRTSNSSIHTNPDMESWIASVHVASNPLGSILGGFLMDRYGRRKIIMLGTLPYILGWILIASAQNHAMILVGRSLDGIAKGIVTASRMVHLDELADPRYRGILAGSVSISFVSGILLIYLMGGLLDWREASWLAASIPFLGLIAFMWLPESPIWLVKKRHYKEASDVLKWIWGPKNEIKAELELQDLSSRLNPEFFNGLPRFKDLTSAYKIESWKKILAPCNLKPFFIIHIFNLFQVICGTQLIIFYAMDIVTSSDKDSENSYAFLTAISTAVIRLIFVIIFCFLIFCLDRRLLAVSSGIGSTLSATVLGIILYIQTTWPNSLFTQENEKWVVLGLIMVYIGSSTCGFFSLPFIMAGEVIPTSYRGIMCGYIFAVNDLALFGVVKSYPWLSQLLGMHGVFWFFGVSCFACTIFVYLFLPETQKKSLVAIEDYFRQGNTLWIRRQ